VLECNGVRSLEVGSIPSYEEACKDSFAYNEDASSNVLVEPSDLDKGEQLFQWKEASVLYRSEVADSHEEAHFRTVPQIYYRKRQWE